VSCSILSKATLLKSCSKLIYADIEVILFDLGFVIEPSNFILSRKALDDTVKDTAGELIWPAWPVRSWPSRPY
jgi:hypothetical protein